METQEKKEEPQQLAQLTPPDIPTLQAQIIRGYNSITLMATGFSDEEARKNFNLLFEKHKGIKIKEEKFKRNPNSY